MSRIASNQRHTDFSERLNVFPCSSEFSVYNYVLAFSWGFTTVITFSFSSVKGWFYKDFFLGSQPNKKLEKERGKKYKARCGSEPLPPFRSLLHSVPESDLGRKTRSSTSREDFPRTKTFKLPGKEEEKKERERSLKLREAIRAKHFLPGPSRKNPRLTQSEAEI
ncbi:uncharacterized protein LOC114974280 [Acropora millepora]|uniref:uncharacterized protein LOC114974280 n=1 Tax=Acropora millepora TaxID=45264 RepID=UPI001CF46B6C|nr:uncharacterized protein LOC114974280 [Acropora millepora]